LMLASAILAVALVFTPEDAHVAHSAAVDFVKDCTPRDAGTIRGRLAANWILDRVSRSGVDASLDVFRAPTPDGDKPFANVVVELPGESTNALWVVLVSHFDTAPRIGEGFEGANDGASTTGLLIALAGALRRGGKCADNVALIWTDGEEARIGYAENDGFHGAKHIVRKYLDEKRDVKAVIGLDMLGDRDLHVTIPANGYPALRKIANFAAERAGVADKVSLSDEVVHDDFSIFHDAGFPAINLIDFSYGPNNSWWHTPQDTVDKISEDSLSVSGKLVVSLLNLIERR